MSLVNTIGGQAISKYNQVETEVETQLEEQIKDRINEQGLSSIPNELLIEIASHLENRFDICNMRIVSKRFACALLPTFSRALVQERTVYPRYDSVAHFTFLLRTFPALSFYVRSICLVAEGLNMHEYGAMWAWEALLQWRGYNCTGKDMDIINEINTAHANNVATSNAFIISGGYRNMLGQLLATCPNLEVLNIRKLKTDEHIPGWIDPAKFQELSFYHPGIYTKFFYGDWEYDTVHHRITMYKDEFGDDIIEPGAGPQAGFTDDMVAAITFSGKTLKVNFAPS